jgi:hypothetical protein
MISITYDKSSIPPVVFNNVKYDVSSIQLYSPSVHYFNNNKADAEIIINHTSNSSGVALGICIPIITNGVRSEGSQILIEILNAIDSKPLKFGDNSISIKSSDYNLNSIIPDKSYYFYNVASTKTDYIVYGITDAITVDSSLIDDLQKLIQPFKNTEIFVGEDLFFNSNGPSAGNYNSGEIYIDCKPTGNSEETEDITYNKSTASTNDLGEIITNIIKNPYFAYAISIVVIVILLIFIRKGLNFVD